jgi:hypothetical protein
MILFSAFGSSCGEIRPVAKYGRINALGRFSGSKFVTLVVEEQRKMTEKLVLPKAGLPKKWQKFQNMILLPSGRKFDEEDLGKGQKIHFYVVSLSLLNIFNESIERKNKDALQSVENCAAADNYGA